MTGRARRAAHGAERAAPRTWFTRVRALLAGALVLGVGGSLTLAAWTDTEVTTASFESSAFGIVGSTNGTDFAEHPSDATTLAFTVTPDRMSPGKTVYARYTVKSTAATNVAGTVQLGGATTTGALAAHLRYGVRLVSGECTAATYDAATTTVVANASALTAGASGPDQAQQLAAGGGSTANYCFAVTLPAGTPSSAQGQSATATWVFTATSSS